MPAAHLPHIRALQTDDLQDALTLSTSAGWNQRIDDWRLLRTVARGGSFAAVSGNRVVGTAMAIDYGGFAWIAMMLVEPSHRGRGLGARLLEAAMTAVRPEFPIRLDATPAGRGLYLKYGFEDEAMLTRSVAPARTGGAPVTPGGPAVRSLIGADLTDVARADRTVFGGDRSAVLGWALEQAPQYARMVQGGGGPPQYCFGRPGRLFDQIGPIVAADADSATALVRSALLSAGGRAVVVDAFQERGAFTAWLRANGFEGERPLFRMERRPQAAAQPARARSGLPTEFAILGPDLA